MQIESIVIVGGGSSGWMSAALLSKTFPDIEIALIESERPPIGVGESTLGHFNRYLRRMELEDKDWMPHCNATYKTSIAFKNFREGKGERFHYPFGSYDFADHKNTLWRFFELQCQYGKDVYPPEEFGRFINHNTWLAEECRIAKEIPNSDFHFANDTAYHFDAELFGQYLKTHHAIPNGVVHLLGNVQNVIKRPDGYIDSIITDDGGIVSADLFIDCTGFKSLLLEHHMGVEFMPVTDKLFNDSALAAQIPYVDRQQQMETYTDCVAMNAGWVWNIPLWHRVGTGYCYSSKYINRHEAEREFREYLSDRYSPEIAQSAHIRPIKIKHGRHKKGWEKNVVGIGLAYGFLEPLESTGLMTTHECIVELCDLIQKREGFVGNFDRQQYNYFADNMLEAMGNFVAAHYALSKRQDTKYWQDCVEKIDFEVPFGSPHSTIMGYGSILDLVSGGVETFNKTDTNGLVYLAAGMDYRPVCEGLYKEKTTHENVIRVSEVEISHDTYQQERESMLEWCQSQPSHYEYLLEHIYGTDEYIQEEETVG